MRKLPEKMLSRWLALDPESSGRLAKLTGKVVRVEFRGIRLTCQLVFQDRDILLRWEDFLPEDLMISGTPLRLFQLKWSRERQSFFADDVTVSGDMKLARDVLALFDDCQPDWDEWLSHWVGDIPAHQTGRFLRRLRNMIQTAGERFSDSITEYMQEEVAFCPPREALQDFYNDVDALRLQLDRLEARVMAFRSQE